MLYNIDPELFYIISNIQVHSNNEHILIIIQMATLQHLL